jgi:LAGLIDADG endonuclease
VSGAENQQESLIEFRGWVIGFVDGEGCFSIGFVRQPDRKERRGYKTGYQVFHRFVVTQGVKSVDCLEALRDFFGVGRIFINERHDNHREHLCQYLVGRRTDLMEAVIPFFRQYPLRTAKRADFDKFAQCVELTANGSHLTHKGLIRIAEIAQTMNRQKPRHELIRILRGHTPDALDRGR